MHTIMVKDNDDIIAFVYNIYGHKDDQHKPALMMQGIPIRQIACGYNYTVILGEENDVFVVGNNCDGQLGLGQNYSQNKPIRLMGEISHIACGISIQLLSKIIMMLSYLDQVIMVNLD